MGEGKLKTYLHVVGRGTAVNECKNIMCGVVHHMIVKQNGEVSDTLHFLIGACSSDDDIC